MPNVTNNQALKSAASMYLAAQRQVEEIMSEFASVFHQLDVAKSALKAAALLEGKSIEVDGLSITYKPAYKRRQVDADDLMALAKIHPELGLDKLIEESEVAPTVAFRMVKK